MSETAEKKPCPFCRSTLTSLTEYDRYPHSYNPQAVFYIGCDNCEAMGPEALNPDEALLLWNERETTTTDTGAR